ncbi:protein CNGC15b-like isoform X1 [Herrania umbratica]|uniref:Protein CNGC15b-like isoform X1 n=1 Tax=Herrania umbratica TaxID=108875 RepID=A0A6J1ARN5_9ROSI|nr:protein CNGC15b-like isoform X1 [Herrania umbratica]
MASGNSKSVRFQNDPEKTTFTSTKGGHLSKFMSKMNCNQVPELRTKTFEKTAIGKTFHKKELSRVFSEDYEVVEKTILDPRGPDINKWNKLFLVACLISLFVDPLFFYLPQAKKSMCITVSLPLEIDLTVTRSVVDAFYIIQIFVRFRTAYVAPSSRVFGRGELVIDPTKIASRYLHKDFWLDIIAAQPLPQVLVWAVIPKLRGSFMVTTKNIVRLIIIFQYLLRLYLIFPLSSQIIKTSGVVTETAWAGAAYNLMLYMLASHVLGASWYLLSLERQEECWRKVCSLPIVDCRYEFFDCSFVGDPARAAWFNSSNISGLCDPRSDFFPFGIYADALQFGVTSEGFIRKYLYCLWWGLRNLSSLGQGLFTSTYVGEIIFAIIIAIVGLVLFALLIGNMQTYLQSTTVRLEEWRIRRTDTEQWMHHRQLPHELKQSVRSYDQYKWVATRGVDEEAILKSLPMDLRRDIKRHLCLDLVRQVPLFDLMDDRMLDAICERLKPCLRTPSTCLVREGDPLNEMLFIVRGHLDSFTTNGGRTGFFNSSRIGPGDFCGEELLTWALDPRPNIVLPSSTRTVKAITEVEAFALVSEDLKFVAAQFRRLHSKQLRHTFRFHSHQWRTWAACFIQAAWFRYKRRKGVAELKKWESMAASSPEQATEQTGAPPLPPVASGFASYAAKLAASTRSRGGSMRCGTDFDILGSLQKPNEPDFTVEDR